MIEKILIRGAKVHNLKNIDVDIPLGKIVGIAGVSGSGKSSLAMGVLYAEGSRRYLEALSTYTRRRMTQASKASVDEVLYVPAALALHQRPGIPGIRSTFGTGTELLNSLRLMYSRLSNHRCPNGHYLKPSLAVAAGKELVCSECGVHFYAPSAEELAFNSQGACQKCGGTGIVHTVDMASLVPDEMKPMAESICETFESMAKRLIDLGLGYLTLDRSAATLSTGERQRMQLARAVRNRTTGVLYVLDEPSIGLHPSNIVGLTGVMHDLVSDGNSVILVDHDTQILKEADWIVEMGPEAGANGGHVIAQGTIADVEANPASQIGPFISGKAETKLRSCATKEELFANGNIHLSTSQIHTVKPLEVDIPKGRLTVVTGVSGSGKTTLVLESLIPALDANINGHALPEHIRNVTAEGIRRIKLIDATPIGINVRSTVATYAGVHDELRKLYAKSEDAKNKGYKARDFSYNTGSLRCSGCDGTGVVSLDVQFLPDVNIQCPDCHGSRYSRIAYDVKLTNKAGESVSLPELMDMDINTAVEFCKDMKTVGQKLNTLKQLGLGYLTLGEETPSLSGGEAQRLKLASEIGKIQSDSVFVFDEPSIGLHPLDVQVLLKVFQALLDNGATVIVIEHDLDVIRNADYVIDMGPGGGENGGKIIASGTPQEIKLNKKSITGRYL